MIRRHEIDVFDLVALTFGVWDKTWFLLTAGDFVPEGTDPAEARRFNSMTVSWGGLGFIWGKLLAIVVVRPQRYTQDNVIREIPVYP